MNTCRRRLRILCLLAWFTFLIGIPNSLVAQDNDFWIAGTGFFDDDVNWADESAPGISDDANFNLGTTYSVQWDSITGDRTNNQLAVSNGNVTFLSIGAGAPYRYTLTDSMISLGGTLNLGSSATQTLDLEVDNGLSIDGATLNVRHGSNVDVLNLTLNSDNATALNVTGGSRLSYGAGQTAVLQRGAVNISGDSSIITGGQFIFGGSGFSGNGTLTIEDGGTLSVDEYRASAAGSQINGLVIDGAGSSLLAASEININTDSRAQTNLRNGGRMETGRLNIGGEFGRVDATDAGTEIDVNSLYVASSTPSDMDGRLLVRNGATLTTGFALVGGSQNSSGVVLLQSGADWNAGNIFVGASGPTLVNQARIDATDASIQANFVNLDQDGLLKLTNSAFTTNQLQVEGGQLDFRSGAIVINSTSNELVLDNSLIKSGSLVLNESRTLSTAGQLRIDDSMKLRLGEASNLNASSVINNGILETANSATVQLGDLSRHDGYAGTGKLVAALSSTVTLDDAGFAQLGYLTEVNGGTLNAINGVAISAGGVLRGGGSVNARIAGGDGSAIYARAGDLTIGDSSHVAGFTTSGELYTGSNTITIRDANQAKLGSYSQLGDTFGSGVLDIQNGAVIGFGDNLVGYGSINSQNLLEAAIINNGNMSGDSIAQRLVLEGYVKGVGTFDNVQFNGTFAPGLSPTITRGNNLFFGSSNILEMELGGLVPGDEHDAIWADGLLSLDGTLDVVLINGFNPTLGDSFDLFNWGSIQGSFHTFDLPTLDAGLRWDATQLNSTGSLSVTAVPEPGSSLLVCGLLVGILARRRRIV